MLGAGFAAISLQTQEQKNLSLGSRLRTEIPESHRILPSILFPADCGTYCERGIIFAMRVPCSGAGY